MASKGADALDHFIKHQEIDPPVASDALTGGEIVQIKLICQIPSGAEVKSTNSPRDKFVVDDFMHLDVFTKFKTAVMLEV